MLTRIRQHIVEAPAPRRSWLLAALLLGVLGMHGLVASSEASASHHGWAPAALASHVASDHAIPHSPGHAPEDNALALCMALLLAFGVARSGGRRTTWVADLTTRVRRAPLPFPPVLRDRSPVPRFTVMRC